MNAGSSTDLTHAAGLKPVHWHLPEALLDALRSQAAIDGVAVEVIAAWVVEAGLIDLGLMPNGRCSLRTGLCGGGPVPLPIQQSASTTSPTAAAC
ncbi:MULTISPECIES: hypothetical protein [Aphanothece]|uniref:hypothetical protein n=1 Tax=Aphanothece TaxID=1121 RepID=UPI00398E66C5